jgi:calcium-dependent protein kinase
MGCLCPPSQSPTPNMNLLKVIEKPNKPTKRSSSLNSINLEDLYQVNLESHSNFFADFRLSSQKIGSGRHGVIKLCYKKTNNKKFAVKLLKKDPTSETFKLNLSILRQVQYLSVLNHPSLLKIHSFYEDHINFYIVMDHFKQGDLYERLIKNHKFCETCTSRIMRQIFSALAFLHSKGLAHRDIKLENMLLEENDSEILVKITDFDTFGVLDGKFFHQFQGSLPYMAPEVLKRWYNEKCDVWSAGVAMFAMLTGRYPFVGETSEEICGRILNQELDGSDFIGISNDAVGLIKKVLEKDPEKRFSAAEAYRHGWILKNSYRSIQKPVKIPGYDALSHGLKLWALQYVIDDYDLVHFELAFLQSDSNLDGFLDTSELSDYLKLVSHHESTLIISHGFWTTPNHLNFYEFISVMAPSSFWEDHYSQILSEFPLTFPTTESKIVFFLKSKLKGPGRFSVISSDEELTERDLWSLVTK